MIKYCRDTKLSVNFPLIDSRKVGSVLGKTFFPRTGTQPETLVNILITVIDKTPAGGATMEDLLDAYMEINDRRPSKRTIYRLIRRLNLFFDPLCYGEKLEPGEKKLSKKEIALTGEKTICSRRGSRGTCYYFRGEKEKLLEDDHDLILLLLGLYPQLKGVMKNSIKTAMRSIFRNTLTGFSTFAGILSELEHVVYVSGDFPVDSAKSEARISEILRALREKKRVAFSYLRTYDGAITKRVVEPHGLLCRLNRWYLTGRCIKREQRRVFLLLNIKDLTVIENSFYSIPPDFSLKKAYKNVWGTWTEDESGAPEEIRLIVRAGPAERFRHNLFHESQQVKELPGGKLEVIYRLTAAQEMIPWLMSWGSAVEVLEPPWLRERLIKNIEETMHYYLKND